MIITEEQMIQLMNLARAYSEKLKSERVWGGTLAYDINCLLLAIQNQQSDELKELEC